ncbi:MULTISPECIES: hypothetical protein [unclassified Crossiella]|uniref:hypothetical protein n=1 Tax=unclassified Crossiella TaxID=2620835 RepID=UPI001FFE7E40|nr:MULTISPECIES: hypothetical protein [unclassified Crossiella]MCK2240872.1 hypothetical protein [Crossiella sp. S99.2]MCK2253984.1 hypothetical protein [Crossiella sp. S99.1]
MPNEVEPRPRLPLGQLVSKVFLAAPAAGLAIFALSNQTTITVIALAVVATISVVLVVLVVVGSIISRVLFSEQDAPAQRLVLLLCSVLPFVRRDEQLTSRRSPTAENGSSTSPH